jgi:hypothetical protein
MRFKPILLVLAVLALAGCAAKARHVATVTVVSAKGALDITQDTEPLLVCGVATAPPAPACVTADVHKAIHAQLAEAYEVHKQLATAVRDWPQGQPAPATIPAYLAQITELLQHIVDALPAGGTKDRLTTLLTGGKS